MVDIKKYFDFLVKHYGMSYKQQFFKDWGNWMYSMHSYYNKNGCFTIQELLQEEEFEFYYAQAFSSDRDRLCERRIFEQSVEPGVWEKEKKKFLFAYRPKLYIKTVAKVVKMQIDKEHCFFGIKV